jgi:hypothetical protein
VRRASIDDPSPISLQKNGKNVDRRSSIPGRFLKKKYNFVRKLYKRVGIDEVRF